MLRPLCLHAKRLVALRGAHGRSTASSYEIANQQSTISPYGESTKVRTSSFTLPTPAACNAAGSSLTKRWDTVGS